MKQQVDAYLNRFGLNTYLVITGVLIVLTALILYLMGRIPICECGYVKLWHGNVFSSENSQHLTDWYTFSHIIHGFAFYWFATLLFKRWPLGAWLVLATIVEAGWEILENTDFIINRYRETTISLDYFGDSIINSVFDIIAMVVGFWLARKLPVWFIIALVLIFEITTTYLIRDGLLFNIIMLIYPFEFILEWQNG